MPDDGDMDVISKAHEVDPVFAEVTSLIFGDAVDIRELYDISKMNDASEMHVTGNLRMARHKCRGKSCKRCGVAKREISAKEAHRQKRQAQIGLASNVVGITAGGAALGSAMRDERLIAPGSPKTAKTLYRAGEKLPKISPRTGRAGALVALGALGLQAGNLAGDAVANRVLARESKKKVVTKALDEALQEIIKARRAGQITTDTALQLAESVTEEISKLGNNPLKWVPELVRGARGAVNNNMARPPAMRVKARAHQVAGLNPIVRANRRAAAAQQLAADAPKATRTALFVTGAAGAAGGAYVGSARATKKVRAQYEAPVAKADLVDYAFTGTISKMDEDKRLAFGWCSLSEVDGKPVIDLQGDYAPIEEIEKSAYAYVIDSRVGGDMHARDGERAKHTSDLVESFISTPEKLQQMGLSEEVAKSVPVGWWVGFKVKDDEQWAMVKDGRRAGFSIHGKGSRVQKALEIDDD